MHKIIGIGESILDIVFQNDQPEKAVPGGSTFNCMISLARCGLPAAFITELGNDKTGRLIQSFMKENGLSTELIYFFDDGHTPVSMAFLDENRNAEYVFYKDFPEKRLNIDFPEINSDDIIIFGSYFAVNPDLRDKIGDFLRYAQSRKAFLYYDINFRNAHASERTALMPAFLENFALADIIRCSDEDFTVLFPNQSINSVYEQYFLPYKKPLIITQGSKNILLKTPQWECEYSVEAIMPISTIGAGDNFNAGWICAFVKNEFQKSDLLELTPMKWEILIHSAQKFAREVCLSLENYVPLHFLSLR
ncbi:MAG: PfkB family carbohydrate kinase [Candidatus Symbiothrix sp.]|jgi:fructokinase|nr:PfkB family carbohydrate kinase [Candidatus Symbiothrix sp.]